MVWDNFYTQKVSEETKFFDREALSKNGNEVINFGFMVSCKNQIVNINKKIHCVAINMKYKE